MSEGATAADRRQVGASGDVQVEAEATSSVVTTLFIEVAAKRVKKAFDRSYTDIGKNAQVKGFRRGKVPRKVLEKLYGATLPEEIERSLVSETLGDAIELAELAPLVQPEIEADTPTPDAAFTYRARVEVKPEIALPDLSDVKGQRPEVAVAEDAINEKIEGMREGAASLLEEPEEVAAADGHTVTVDFVGTVDGVPFEGGSAEGIDIEIGKGQMIPGFEDGIIGAKAGEDVDVNVTFPEDYGAENLAGKAAVFAMKVNAIRRREVPALDDEFAKDVGDFETLEELRNQVREDLEKEQGKGADARLRESLLESLVSNTEFEVSPGIVERQLQNQMQSMQQQFQNQVPPDILQAELRRMSEEGRETAERRVREAFLLEAIAKQSSLSVTDEEVDARLEEMAGSQGVDPATMRQLAQTQGWADSIRSELMDQKTLEFLTSKATVETVAPIETGEAS